MAAAFLIVLFLIKAETECIEMRYTPFLFMNSCSIEFYFSFSKFRFIALFV